MIWNHLTVCATWKRPLIAHAAPSVKGPHARCGLSMLAAPPAMALMALCRTSWTFCNLVCNLRYNHSPLPSAMLGEKAKATVAKKPAL